MTDATVETNSFPHPAASPASCDPSCSGVVATALSVVPGLLLTSGIAAAAFGLHALPGMSALSPLILSISIGMALNAIIGTQAWAKPGVTFALRRILRVAIVLLGLQLTTQQVVAIGGAGLAIIVAALSCTFLLTTWTGRLLGVNPQLTQLIAAGTSICGASAVIATNVVTKARDEDVAYAIACVTVFGSVAMFGYPLLLEAVYLTPYAYGLWGGSSIHEIAQVIAAANQGGADAAHTAIIAKLTRVMMLAPVVLLLAVLIRNRRGAARASAPIPWFILGFVALIIVNSLFVIPTGITSPVGVVTGFGLSVALAAMGLETDARKLRAKGFRPFLLGLLAFLFISGFSLAAIMITT